MEATSIAIIVAFVVGILFVGWLAFCCVRYRWDKWCWPSSSRSRRRPHRKVRDDVMRNTTIERFLEELVNEQPIRFTARQLVDFTNNYSVELGHGGFGTVYKGTLPLRNRLPVAVKVLSSRHNHETLKQQFMAEISTIGRTHHNNLVRLYGFCFDDASAKHALVYEFMQNGSLGDYLSTAARGAGVSMTRVASIATGVARGLMYLHQDCQPKILHLDIKPANVLLDGHLTPKVADFGLAHLLNRTDTHVTVNQIAFTPGYAPPEVIEDAQRTDKFDVYSFGVLLLSIIGRGKENWDSHPDFPRIVWTRYTAGELMKHVGLYGSADEQQRRENRVDRMCKVAFWCMQRQPPARPSMSKVVMMLEGNGAIDPPPNPFQNPDARAPAANRRRGRNN